MEVLEVTENKEQYMELLLLAGEQESMVEKYFQKGGLFALYDDFDLKTAAVVTKEDADTYEIKILATFKIYQGKGYGSSIIKHLIQFHEKKCKRLIVNTGDDENILLFYEKLGFTYSHAAGEKVYFKYSY